MFVFDVDVSTLRIRVGGNGRSVVRVGDVRVL